MIDSVLILLTLVVGAVAYASWKVQNEEQDKKWESLYKAIGECEYQIKNIQKQTEADKESFNKLLNHLELKIVEDHKVNRAYSGDQLVAEFKKVIDSHIEPITANEKRIEELKKEIAILELTDEELK